MLAVVTLVASVVNNVVTHTLSALCVFCTVELTALILAKVKFFNLSVWFLHTKIKEFPYE